MATQEEAARWLELARGLLDCPTAPLREEAPIRHVLAFAAARPALGVRRDDAGNVLLAYPAEAWSEPQPLVFAAHLDHPGFWVEKIDAAGVHLSFQGNIGLAHVMPGTGVRFFGRGSGESLGRGQLTQVEGEGARLHTAVAEVVEGTAEGAGLAMWDFPALKVEDGRLVSRGCDDLLGCAVLLCVLDELVRRPLPAPPLWVLFTRAEEAGFYGALAAARNPALPRGARILSFECSRALPHAPQGGGVIVRLGDRQSLFDAEIGGALRQAAAALAQSEPGFRHQCALLDGGVCEATAFGAAGFRAGGLALPLGNYHNQQGLGGAEPCVGPEHVREDDFRCAVDLLVELALRGVDLEAHAAQVQAWLAARWAKAEPALRDNPLQEQST